MFIVSKAFKTANLQKYMQILKIWLFHITYISIIEKMLSLFQAASSLVNRGCNWLGWVWSGPPNVMRCDEMWCHEIWWYAMRSMMRCNPWCDEIHSMPAHTIQVKVVYNLAELLEGWGQVFIWISYTIHKQQLIVY